MIISDILINELHVTSYELTSSRVAFIARVRVTTYFYSTSYELLFAYELRVPVYCTSYELLFTYELRVIVYCTSYELLFISWFTSYFLHTSYELLFIARFTSYILTISYNKGRDDKVVYDNNVMINNYSLKSFFDKELIVFVLLAFRATNAKTYFLHSDIYINVLCTT